MDSKLIAGAIIFGVRWGASGICPRSWTPPPLARRPARRDLRCRTGHWNTRGRDLAPPPARSNRDSRTEARSTAISESNRDFATIGAWIVVVSEIPEPNVVKLECLASVAQIVAVGSDLPLTVVEGDPQIHVILRTDFILIFASKELGVLVAIIDAGDETPACRKRQRMLRR